MLFRSRDDAAAAIWLLWLPMLLWASSMMLEMLLLRTLEQYEHEGSSGPATSISLLFKWLLQLTSAGKWGCWWWPRGQGWGDVFEDQEEASEGSMGLPMVAMLARRE